MEQRMRFRYGVESDRNGIVLPAVNNPPENARAPEPSEDIHQPQNRSSGLREAVDRLARRLPSVRTANNDGT